MGYSLCIKLPKTREKKSLQRHKTCCNKEVPGRNNKYSNDETFSKIARSGHISKAIAPIVLVKT